MQTPTETEIDPIAALVEKAQAGQSGAFDDLVRKFQDFAVAYAFGSLGDFHRAEDAAQEAFLEAYRALSGLHDPAAFPAWFRTIVFRQCHRLTRGMTLATVSLEAAVDMPSTEVGAVDRLVARESAADIRGQIRKLPEDERVVTTLFYIGEYSQQEIGDFLAIPVTTVKNRLHTARKRLKERMLATLGEQIHAVAPSRNEAFVSRVGHLIAAAQAGDVTEARRLIKREPALKNAVGKLYGWEGDVPTLLVAAARGDLEMASVLIELGADVNATSTWSADKGWGWAPLHIALRNPDMVELLLAHGARYDIFAASRLEDLPRIEEILAEEPGAIKTLGPDGATALHFASSVPVASMLLDQGAEIDALDQFHRSSPAEWAFHAKRRNVFDMLINRGAHLSIIMQCRLEDEDTVRRRIEADPELVFARSGPRDLLAPNATPLHVAAEHGLTDTVRFLIDEGADVDAIGMFESCTPLHYAAWFGRAEVVRLLVERGAKLEVWSTVYGNTALGWAILNGRYDIARILLEAGAALHEIHRTDAVRGARGEYTSFTKATPEGYGRIVTLLLGYGSRTVD